MFLLNWKGIDEMIIGTLDGNILYNSDNIVYVTSKEKKQSPDVYELILGAISGKEYHLGKMDKEKAKMCAKAVALLMEERFRDKFAEIFVAPFNYSISLNKLCDFIEEAEMFVVTLEDATMLSDIIMDCYNWSVNSFLVPEYPETAILNGLCG